MSNNVDEPLPDLTEYWEKVRQQEKLRSYSYRNINGITNDSKPVDGNSVDYVPKSSERYYDGETKWSRTSNGVGIDVSDLPEGWQLRDSNPNYAFYDIDGYECPIQLTVRRDGRWWISAKDVEGDGRWITLITRWEGNLLDAVKKVSNYKIILAKHVGISI